MRGRRLPAARRRPGALVAALLVTAAAAAAQGELAFRKGAYRCDPLQFRVSIPKGWEASHSATAMAARGAGMGFRITREPFLHDPKTFPRRWQEQLAAAGVDARVKPARAGRYKGYAASWRPPAGAGRTLHVYRLHVPDAELLYNIAFSLPAGTEPKPLVQGVLRSFRSTAEKPAAGLSRGASFARLRLHLKLPDGYDPVELPPPKSREEAMGRPFALYRKVLPGYKPEHEAARLEVYGWFRGDPEDHVAKIAARTQATLVDTPRTPRVRSARYGGHKGFAIQFTGERDGVSKRYHAFGLKTRVGLRVVVGLLVDDREVRLHKNLFKEICQNIEERGG
ncbi:MAG: hypothetical protein ACE5JG_05300 [Planctomycetota bacterium]